LSWNCGSICSGGTKQNCAGQHCVLCCFLCRLPHHDPLEFENPPLGFPVVGQTCRWVDMLAAAACFLRSMCPDISPVTPSHACSTVCTTDASTTLDSMDGPSASARAVLLGSSKHFLGPAFPVASPGALCVWCSQPGQ
jgi:hypothetical protein